MANEETKFPTRARIIVEELDPVTGKVLDTPSEHTFREFDNDQDGEYCGKKSDDLFNSIIRHIDALEL